MNTTPVSDQSTVDSSNATSSFIEIRNLKMHFPVTQKTIYQKTMAHVKAVDGVSFNITKNKTLGLVEESGCGKTTIGRCILQLESASDGEILFSDEDLTQLNQKELGPIQQKIQMIFQDPYSSLNPRMKIGSMLQKPMRVHGIIKDTNKHQTRVKELLSVCGLDPRFANRYPHEMSNGQRQRVKIARTLTLNPKFIICDEAVSTLDVSIQAQIINLLEDLREEFNLTYLFIAHNLNMVQHISNRMAVMYLGKLIELANKNELFDNPKHPYTQALLNAVPIPNPKIEKKRHHEVIKNEVPSPMNPPNGCVFHPRCPLTVDSCRTSIPEFQKIASKHQIAYTEI